MRWSELNDEQKTLLAAWFILADAEYPYMEELPLEYSLPLAEVAEAAGKHPRRRFIRRGLAADVPSNRRRIVRVTKQRHQLA